MDETITYTTPDAHEERGKPIVYGVRLYAPSGDQLFHFGGPCTVDIHQFGAIVTSQTPPHVAWFIPHSDAILEWSQEPSHDGSS